jgi:hypothetical protein
MLYYRGQEALDGEGQFYLLTSESKFNADLRQSAISGKTLSQWFSRVGEAQLLMFDTQLQGAVAGVENDSTNWPLQTAMLRYTWRSKDDVPRDARLLEAFEKAMPQASRLREIEGAISRLSANARQKYKASFAYEPRIPPPLNDLELSRPAP